MCSFAGSLDNCVSEQERLDESEVSENESPLSDDEFGDDESRKTLQEGNIQVPKSTAKKCAKRVRICSQGSDVRPGQVDL